jgi:glycosyl transferase family 25
VGTGGKWGLSKSKIACFESHRRIWAHALNSGMTTVLIFEDDLRLSRHAAEVVRRLMASSGAFDVVKIDYSPKVLPYGPADQINDMNVRALLETASSAGGYIVSRSGCRKLLDWSQTYSDHLDDFIFMPRPDWRVFKHFPLSLFSWFSRPRKRSKIWPRC